VAEALPVVVKRDNRRELFNRDKVMLGLRKACEKRPVSIDILEKIVERLERWAQERGGNEIDASEIGERLMEELQEVDDVAYVRFASVYRQFKDINQFMGELKGILERRERKGVHGDN
jgi:transcriptional repressor NrdR